MKINRRKATWYPKVSKHVSRAVTTSGAWIKRAGGDERVPTEFALRNPHIIDALPDEQDFIRHLCLHTVHEGRELITEMTPATPRTSDTRSSARPHGQGSPTTRSRTASPATESHGRPPSPHTKGLNRPLPNGLSS